MDSTDTGDGNLKHIKRGKFLYLSNNSHGWCRIDIVRNGEKYVVVFTEMNANPGASVTNAIEDIVNTFFETMPHFNIHNTEFVERYEDKPKELDAITLMYNEKGRHASNPTWRRMRGDPCLKLLEILDVK